jgi:hypothetical protein
VGSTTKAISRGNSKRQPVYRRLIIAVGFAFKDAPSFAAAENPKQKCRNGSLEKRQRFKTSLPRTLSPARQPEVSELTYSTSRCRSGNSEVPVSLKIAITSVGMEAIDYQQIFVREFVRG